MCDLSHYAPAHRSELEELLRAPDWQDAIRCGLVEEVQGGKIEPGDRRNFINTVTDPLLAFNERRVKGLIADGCRDEDRLLAELSRWPHDLEGKDPAISFLGLNVTAECDSDPRCVYCNQPWVASSVGLAGWKAVLDEVTGGVDDAGEFGDVADPPTLGLKPTARAQKGPKLGVELLLCGNPVERGAGKDRVDRRVQLELEQIGVMQLDLLAEALPRELDHLGRGIDPDHPTLRDQLSK